MIRMGPVLRIALVGLASAVSSSTLAQLDFAPRPEQTTEPRMLESEDAADGIIPFKSIGGIVPGQTPYGVVVKRYGRPDSSFVSPVARFRVLKFNKVGLWVWQRPPFSLDHPIGAVMVRAPYGGRSPEGLFIGMDQREAIAIVTQNYAITHQRSHFAYVAEKDTAKHGTLYLGFNEGILQTIRFSEEDFFRQDRSVGAASSHRTSSRSRALTVAGDGRPGG